MYDQTKFWLAQEVANAKDTHDVRGLFRKGMAVAGKKPMTLITDGLAAYHDAYLKEYWQHKVPRPQHMRHITIQGDRNNNKMQRFNE